MSWVAVAIVGAAVVGAAAGYISNQSSTSDVLDAQRDNTDRAAREAREQTDKANEAIIKAAEISAAGMTEAAAIAAEEARMAREQALAYVKEATAQAQGYLDATLGSTEPVIRKAQEDALAILDEFGEKSADLYRPYIGAGQEALARYQELANRGVTLRGGQIVRTTTSPGQAMSYDDWKAQKLASTPGLNYTGGSQRFNEETGQLEGVTEEQLQAEYQQYVDALPQTTTTTTEEGPYDIEKSPYYPLYQYQKEQQQKAIDAQLSARGLYRSGEGIKEQVKADTGLTESFVATEYQRAVDDYNRQLAAQGALMGVGYEASGNLANIYNTLGANKANLVQWGGGTLANLRAQIGTAKANAALGQGTSLANISQQTGSQLANIYSQLGTNTANAAMQSGQTQASGYNQLGGTLANIYVNSGNNQASLLNQQAQNRQNMFAGLTNTAIYGLSRYNNPVNTYNYPNPSNWGTQQYADQGYNMNWGSTGVYPSY